MKVWQSPASRPDRVNLMATRASWAEIQKALEGRSRRSGALASMIGQALSSSTANPVHIEMAPEQGSEIIRLASLHNG